MLRSITLATAFLLSVCYPGCQFAVAEVADALVSPASRVVAPGFSLVDAEGKQITLADLKGKVVLLDFWATWCGGCKLEIPWFMQFDEKYRRQGLAAVGVSMDDDGWKAVRPFLAKGIDSETGGNIAMRYPVVIGNQELASKYHLGNMPMTVLIDRNGSIALSHTGVVDKAKFEAAIAELLR
jgi:peroxiredoxin